MWDGLELKCENTAPTYLQRPSTLLTWNRNDELSDVFYQQDDLGWLCSANIIWYGGFIKWIIENLMLTPRSNNYWYDFSFSVSAYKYGYWVPICLIFPRQRTVTVLIHSWVLPRWRKLFIAEFSLGGANWTLIWNHPSSLPGFWTPDLLVDTPLR